MTECKQQCGLDSCRCKKNRTEKEAKGVLVQETVSDVAWTGCGGNCSCAEKAKSQVKK